MRPWQRHRRLRLHVELYWRRRHARPALLQRAYRLAARVQTRARVWDEALFRKMSTVVRGKSAGDLPLRDAARIVCAFTLAQRREGSRLRDGSLFRHVSDISVAALARSDLGGASAADIAALAQVLLRPLDPPRPPCSSQSASLALSFRPDPPSPSRMGAAEPRADAMVTWAGSRRTRAPRSGTSDFSSRSQQQPAGWKRAP